MNRTTQHDSDRDGDRGFNLSGGGLVGHKDAGLDQAREAGAVRAALAGRSAPAADAAVAGEAGAARSLAGATDTGRDIPLRRAGTPGEVADGASLTGASGGERASGGINPADRDSRDHGNSLGA